MARVPPCGEKAFRVEPLVELGRKMTREFSRMGVESECVDFRPMDT